MNTVEVALSVINSVNNLKFISEYKKYTGLGGTLEQILIYIK